MNLRDKFKKADKDSILTQTLSVKCVKIADEFAIGFAEWVLDVYIEHKQNYILEE